jgi:TonB family protein
MSLTSANFDRNARAEDRRVHFRQPVRSLAYVELGDGNGGIALNISEGGMAVQAVMSLGGDDLPALRVQLSHSKKQIELKGRVAWTADLRKLAGVQFVDVSDDTRRQLREWISLESPDRAVSVRPEASIAAVKEETTTTTASPAVAARPAASRHTTIVEVPLEPDESRPADELAATPPAPAIAETPKPAPVAFPSRPRNPVVPAADVPPAFNPVAASSPVTELPKPVEFPDPLENLPANKVPAAADIPSELDAAKPALPKEPSLPSRLPSLPTRPAALPRKSASFFAAAAAPAAETAVTRDPVFLPEDRFGFRQPETDASTKEAKGISPAKWKTSTWVAIFALVALVAGWVAGHGSFNRGLLRSGSQQAPSDDVNETVTEEDSSQPSASSAPPPAQIEVIDSSNRRWIVPISPAAGRATAVALPKNADNGEPASASSAPPAISVSTRPQNSSAGGSAAPAVVSSSSVPARNASAPAAPSETRNGLPSSSQQEVVQNDLLPGELIHKVEPEYPPAALDQKVEGTVKIMAVIDVNGNVKSAQPLSGPRMLIPPALEAVRQWKYGPTMLHGQAIETQRQITIAFEVAKSE